MMVDQTQLSTRQSLMQELGLTEQEIARRKAFLLFHDEDEEHLRGLHELAEKYVSAVIEDFYEHLLAFDGIRSSFAQDLSPSDPLRRHSQSEPRHLANLSSRTTTGAPTTRWY